MQIKIAFGTPDEQWEKPLALPDGASVGLAIQAIAKKKWLPSDPTTMDVGIWGKIVPWSERLKNGDRLEFYRPLIIDPKDARRLRAQRNPLKKPLPKKRVRQTPSTC